jgi:hypothetical protein
MVEFQITKTNLSWHELGLYPIHGISQTPFILKLPWPTSKPKRYKKNQYKYNLGSSFKIQKCALFQVTCTLITTLVGKFYWLGLLGTLSSTLVTIWTSFDTISPTLLTIKTSPSILSYGWMIVRISFAT